MVSEGGEGEWPGVKKFMRRKEMKFGSLGFSECFCENRRVGILVLEGLARASRGFRGIRFSCDMIFLKIGSWRDV